MKPISELKSKTFVGLAIVIMILLVVVAVLMVKGPTASLNLDAPQAVVLNENIDAFVEKLVTENPESRRSTLGGDNYHCSHITYGIDNTYAYTWMYCSGFLTKDDGSLEQGSAFSAPYRLEFTKPNMAVVSAKTVGDGSLYMTDLKKLFPEPYYGMAYGEHGSAEMRKLQVEVEAEAKSKSQ